MKHPDIAQHIPKPGYGYVYHITVEGKNYIGISTTPWSVRWQKHKSPTSGCKKLVRALNNCREHSNWQSISVEFLQDAKEDKLDALQRKYIKKYGSYKTWSGLNSTPGGRDVYPFHSAKKYKHRKRPAPRPPRRFIAIFEWQSV